MTWLTRVVAVAVLCLTGSPAHAQDNAADHYRRAFELNDRLLSRADHALLSGNDPVDVRSPRVADVLGRTRAVVDAVRAGAAAPRCDWGVDYSAGLETLFPSLSPSRQAALLSILHARAMAAAGDMAGAVDVAAAVLTLGTHTSDRVLASRLVGAGTATLAVEFLAEHLPAMPEPALQDLDARLAAYRRGHDAAECVAFERELVVRWLRALSDHRPAAAGGAGLPAGLDNLLGIVAEQDRGQVPDAWRDPDRRLRAIDELDRTFARLVELMRVPNADLPTADAEAHRLRDAAGPLTRALRPSVVRFRMRLDAEAARLAMLRAAIAVVRAGPDALDDHPDPFGAGRPFDHRETDGGFELTSRANHWDREPVTLRVGK